MYIPDKKRLFSLGYYGVFSKGLATNITYPHITVLFCLSKVVFDPKNTFFLSMIYKTVCHVSAEDNTLSFRYIGPIISLGDHEM